MESSFTPNLFPVLSPVKPDTGKLETLPSSFSTGEDHSYDLPLVYNHPGYTYYLIASPKAIEYVKNNIDQFINSSSNESSVVYFAFVYVDLANFEFISIINKLEMYGTYNVSIYDTMDDGTILSSFKCLSGPSLVYVSDPKRNAHPFASAIQGTGGVVTAVHPVTNETYVLLIKRGPSSSNKWTWPGGAVSSGMIELDENVQREVKEETGLDCIPQHIMSYSHQPSTRGFTYLSNSEENDSSFNKVYDRFGIMADSYTMWRCQASWMTDDQLTPQLSEQITDARFVPVSLFADAEDPNNYYQFEYDGEFSISGSFAYLVYNIYHGYNAHETTKKSRRGEETKSTHFFF